MTVKNESGVSPGSSASSTVDDAKEEISRVTDESADTAKKVAETRFEQGREATTEQLDSASEDLNDVAKTLEENDSPFASYAAELSDQLSSFSGKLSTSSIDDLVGGARSLARDNPAAFMLGSMAIGLAASRFFKATGEQVSRQSGSSTRRSAYDESGQDQGAAFAGQYDANAGTGMPRSTATTASPGVRPSVSQPVVDRGNTRAEGDLGQQTPLTDRGHMKNTEEA